MCGIAAVLSSGAPVSADAVRAGIAALDHRGLGARVVLDQALTIAMSYVFLHEGLGITS